MRPVGAWLILPLALWACRGGEREVSEAPEAPDSVALAEGLFDAGAFDTIRWEDENDAIQRGAVVWQFSCSKCHGATGLGDGEAARALGLRVPSLLDRDWPFADDLPGLRHRIFVGTPGPMPNWGLHGLKHRDLDAVARFILKNLRAARTG